jgi:lipoprotein-anchoring transpeptidase ErfK/SrfK
MMELRRPSRRLIVAAAVTFSVMAAAIAWTWPWLQGWHHPPLTARSEAESALQVAVGSDGVLPEEIALLRQHMDRSFAEDRRQSAAFAWRRDFRQAASEYRLTAATVASVLESAGRRVAEARQAAEAAVGRSNTVVGDAVRLADNLPFPPHERARLQRARSLAEEARLAMKKGDYESAVKAASRATQEAQAARVGAMPNAARFADPGLIAKWRGWVNETINRTKGGGSAVIVYKERNEVALYQNGVRTRTYNADLGKNRLQPKRVSGDGATPEGRYRITSKRAKGATKYYKALMLDYPNAEDRREFDAAKRAGRIARNARIGHLIEIHGNGGRDEDWTQGCVALSDRDIDDLFSRVSVGTPVTIVGGDGNGGAYSDVWRAHASSLQGAR